MELEFTNIECQDRNNQRSKIVPESGLECKTALTVEEKVFGKTGPILAKLFVQLSKT